MNKTREWFSKDLHLSCNRQQTYSPTIHHNDTNITTMSVRKGSCLCGKITLKIHGPALSANLCYCTNCQKSLGSVLASFATFAAAKVEYNDPESMMRTYSDTATDSGNTVGRSFCANCGSPVRGDSSKFPGFLILPVGCVDGGDADKADLRPTAEYFCISKAAWLPQVEGTEKVELGPAVNYN
ncbi:hypothetical protein MCOR25_009689 [Pyricularia grisea]|uniref:CENP-V/GFA domain-containing protein n=1 Tax=Pyricularia grisea TaxID=148305 RepID=A0A6P8BGJ9_PYRGI|nr:uncharacterized protein PgNI_00155 [Pyricularia grisea]KAI6351895.1 hypothetical protein MCOR25_009689 [Pyricularia grisea]TLD15787.1 hypothetical protein PgNI_00155 [Pyricularia grisea]